jgi:predicted O-methyltransferase YrrM
VQLTADQQLVRDTARDFCDRELAPHVREFNPPRRARAAREFQLDNGTYGSVDAEVLYAMLRRHRPSTVVELGSGASSLAIAAALRRNRDEGRAAVYTAFDPFPRDDLAPALREATDLRRVSATEVPLDVFRALGAGDVLFVDTTHTVKAGSDVNRIVLDVLPALAPGVLVHVHDVTLPFLYHRTFGRDFYDWQETTLVLALLQGNASLAVRCCLSALHYERRRELEDLFSDYRAQADAAPGLAAGRAGDFPSSLWFETV